MQLIKRTKPVSEPVGVGSAQGSAPALAVGTEPIPDVSSHSTSVDASADGFHRMHHRVCVHISRPLGLPSVGNQKKKKKKKGRLRGKTREVNQVDRHGC